MGRPRKPRWGVDQMLRSPHVRTRAATEGGNRRRETNARAACTASEEPHAEGTRIRSGRSSRGDAAWAAVSDSVLHQPLEGQFETWAHAAPVKRPMPRKVFLLEGQVVGWMSQTGTARDSDAEEERGPPLFPSPPPPKTRTTPPIHTI